MESLLDEGKKYESELMKWCKETSQGSIEKYFDTFLLNIKEALDLVVTFDDRIILVIGKMFKKHEFLEYSAKTEHESFLKAQILKISEVLYANNFISKIHKNYIQNHLANRYLYSQFLNFLGRVKQKRREKGNVSRQELDNIWSHEVDASFQVVWTYIMKKNIRDAKILQMINQCQPLIEWHRKEFKDSLNHFYESIIRSRIILESEDRKLSDKEFKYNSILDKFIISQSLMMNQELKRKAFDQIFQLFRCIKGFSEFFINSTYEVYGSLRSGFALINEADADINVLTQGTKVVMNREDQKFFLEKLAWWLRNKFCKSEKRSIQLFVFEDLKVPFIKVKYFGTSEGYKSSQEVLYSIDVVINSSHGSENSKMLELYSKNLSILKLCNLVKLWAKRKNIINTLQPMKGLSSYGVILMVIYYLIKTDQVPYVVINEFQKCALAKPLPKEEEIMNLLANFKGWLSFYDRTGTFFREKLIVCLLEKYKMDEQLKKKDYFINMYDFIDDTNPGRLEKNQGHMFFREVENAADILNNCGSLEDLFSTISPTE